MVVLTTTDGSPRSLKALPHAARLAEVTGARLLVLRILDPRADCAESRAATLADATREVAGSWTLELQMLVQDLRVPAEVVVDVKPRGEEVIDAISRVAAEHRARIIVMATRGAGLLRRTLLGSVATLVLQRAELPVMLTGDHVGSPRDGLPYHALVTSDGSQASESVLLPLTQVFEQAPPENARITLLRVYQEALGDPPREIAIRQCERELEAFKRHAPRRFPVDQIVREVVPLGGVDTAIINSARESGADSIWMATRGHSLRRHLLVGSVALGVISHADVPVVLGRALG